MMTYIDVAIPGAIGLLMVLAPSLFVARTSNAYQDKIDKIRKYGVLLVGVAVLYLVITLFQG